MFVRDNPSVSEAWSFQRFHEGVIKSRLLCRHEQYLVLRRSAEGGEYQY